LAELTDTGPDPPAAQHYWADARIEDPMTRMSPGLNDAALAYLQREVGYVRTGSHVTRAGGQ